MRVLVLGLVLMLGGTAGAESFRIDYQAVFTENGAQVRFPGPTLEVLELDGPVILTRRGGPGGPIRAEDQSGYRPAGCALAGLLYLGRQVAACPGLFTDAERQALSARIARAARFFGDNTVPPMSTQAVGRALRAALVPEHGTVCPSVETEWTRAVRDLASDSGAARMDRNFDLPRLPVTTGCR